MARERVTGLPLVPTIATLLLQHDLSGHRLPHLRYITNAAAALTAAKLQGLRDAFPQAKVYSMYGQTECHRISYLSPHEIDERPGSVGIAIPNSEVFIVDDRGRRVPRGTIGELIVRGRIATLAGERGLGWVEAVAITGGRIVAAGSRDEIDALVGPRTRQLELSPDEAALPGLTDAHLHLADGGLSAERIDLTASRSIDEAAARAWVIRIVASLPALAAAVAVLAVVSGVAPGEYQSPDLGQGPFLVRLARDVWPLLVLEVAKVRRLQKSSFNGGEIDSLLNPFDHSRHTLTQESPVTLI